MSSEEPENDTDGDSSDEETIIDDNGIVQHELDNLGFGGDGIEIQYLPGRTLPIPSRKQLLPHPKITLTGGAFYFNPIEVREGDKGGSYYMNLSGQLENGEKVKIRLINIPIDFLILIPKEHQENVDEFKMLYHAKLRGKGDLHMLISKYEIHMGKPFKGYSEHPVKWLKVFVRSLRDRKKIISITRDDFHYETADDDMTFYYRKVTSTRGISLSYQAIVLKYDFAKIDSKLYSYELVVDVDHYISLNSPRLSPEKIKEYEKIIQNNPKLRAPNTFCVGWDIETISTRGTGEVPTADYIEDNCFMICLGAYWGNSTTPVLQICITDKPAKTDARWITIVCASYADILRAFTDCLELLSPDVLIAYNDSNYDWPFIYGKLKQFGLDSDFIKRLSSEEVYGKSPIDFYWRDIKIKITAEETFEGRYIDIPGILSMDLMPVFKRLHVDININRKGSLKKYLEENKLPSKADLNIGTMWRYYRAACVEDTSMTREYMRIIAHYCNIDSNRVQLLLSKRNVLGEHREMAELAKIPIKDVYLFAGGMRVRQLARCVATLNNIFMSMIGKQRNSDEEKKKYPGAFVVPPMKGRFPDVKYVALLQTAVSAGDVEEARRVMREMAKFNRPIAALDYSSLYPSIEMTYNISPDKIIMSREEAIALFGEKALSDERILHHIYFPFDGKIIEAWSVRHDNDPQKMGLYVKILKSLFDSRAEVKAQDAIYQDCINMLEKLIAQCKTDDDITLLDGTLQKFAEKLNIKTITDIKNRLEDYEFLHQAAETKEKKGIKVYMNTFYGEAGNELSSMFLLAVAGGTTTAGVYNIKKAKSFAESHGFLVKYGDTDSLYLSPPDSVFSEIDEKYINGDFDWLTYNTKMVELTMVAIKKLQGEITTMLKEDNGTNFLKMAYEEVVYPGRFQAKKKYNGMDHKKEVNFFKDVSKILVKGIDAKKKNQSLLTRTLADNIMRRDCDINNKLDLIEIIQDELRMAMLDKKWNIKYFIKTAAWRPHKKNISVQKFIARMKIAHDNIVEENKARLARGESALKNPYTLPEPGERFAYVVVRKNLPKYDYRGYRVYYGVSERWEFVNIAKEEKMEIDVEFYFEQYISGVCARFIAYQYEPDDIPDDMPKEEREKIEKDAFNKAKKVIIEYIRSIKKVREDEQKMDAAHMKRRYKDVIEGLRLLFDSPEILTLMLGENIDFHAVATMTANDLVKKIDDCASVSSNGTNFADMHRDMYKRGVKKLGHMGLRIEMQKFESKRFEIKKKLIDMHEHIIAPATKFQLYVQEIIGIIARGDHYEMDAGDIFIGTDEMAFLTQFYNLYYELSSNYSSALLLTSYEEFYTLELQRERGIILNALDKKDVADAAVSLASTVGMKRLF